MKDAFGLIVVGNEVLDGRVRDRHVENARQALAERSLNLAWVLVLPDDPELLTDQLRWAMAQAVPFFCCGGIGSTPDDHTRQCAARAADAPLEFHEEGVAILKERFGPDATPERLRMAEFPRGATLIPNPVNRVSGFRAGNGHFLPGFPCMARPMMEWVLANDYPQGAPRAAAALILPEAREADLVHLMDAFIAAHPALSFSSLPHYTQEGGTEVELGIAGLPEDVESGLRDLKNLLASNGVPFLP
jgi:molybdopterin-biosynthesis enzyme MoeA-like protein